MADMTGLKSFLYKTIHRNTKTVNQLADETGISASYLYRAGLPEDQSGVRFPIEYLIPLMKATKDYSVLTHIAKLCGFLLVRVPRVKGSKKEEIDLVEQYQDSTSKAMRCLREFFNQPTQANYDKIDSALYEVMQESAGAQKYVKKSFSGQLEMEI